MARRARVEYADDPAAVGQRLRSARERAGLSQKELADGICAHAYVSRIESGDRLPSLQLVRALAARLGVSERSLTFGEPDEPRGRVADAVRLGRVAAAAGDLVQVEALVREAFAAATSDADRAAALALSARLPAAGDRFEDVVEAVETARRLHPAIEAEDPDAADLLGRAYARRCDYGASIATFERNRIAAAARGDAAEEIRFAARLAQAHTDNGDFASAGTALAEAVRKSEGGDALTRVRVLWAQARLQSLQNNPELAAGYAERALELLRFGDQTYYLALAHQLLAHIELDRGNAERAEELLRTAAPTIAATGRRYEIAGLQIEQARAALAVGDRERALRKAMTAAGGMNGESSVDAGRAYLLIGDVFVELGEEERALEVYELALEATAAIKHRYYVDACRKLSRLLERRGEEKRALALLNEAMDVQAERGAYLAGPPPHA